MDRRRMMMLEADRCIPVATVFTAAAMVGTGRGVGVVGGGTIHELNISNSLELAWFVFAHASHLLSAFITVPIWQTHCITGNSVVDSEVSHLANLGHL